jgi:glutamine synthetase
MRVVEERGVRFVRLWFVDVVGSLKSLAVPASELEAALLEGVGLDGSAIEANANVTSTPGRCRAPSRSCPGRTATAPRAWSAT